MIQTTARHADLSDLLRILQDQQARKLDVVAPSTSIFAEDGRLRITGTETVLSDDGVTTVDGLYLPTAPALEGIATRLGVPVQYLKRIHTERPDLFDANVNGWLYGNGETGPDDRSHLVRCFRGDDAETGIARAMLSQTYKVVDNIDVLMAALDGIREAGLPVNVTGGDLTDRRMVVRVTAPEVSALAPTLLKGYRSPFTGQTGEENPTVFAGFEISNSETGGGAFTIVPRLVVQVCNNGMKITKDAFRRVHLGARMDDGVVRWSESTQQANLALVKKQTADVVKTVLDVDYVSRVITALEANAETPIAKVEDVTEVTKGLGYTKSQQEGILNYFIQGGQMNRAGIMNAVTAYAQTVTDGDEAYDLEQAAVRVLVG